MPAATSNPPAAQTGWRPRGFRASQHRGTYLIAVIDVGVRKLPCHELVEHNAVGVDIRLEAERVVILHSDHLGGLQGQNAFIHHHLDPTDTQVPGCPSPRHKSLQSSLLGSGPHRLRRPRLRGPAPMPPPGSDPQLPGNPLLPRAV